MLMHLQVIEELGEVEKEYGSMDQSNFKKLIDTAELLNLDCLSGIDLIGDTYFNDEQCLTIKNELKILREKSDISDEVINWMQEGVNFVSQEGYTYLRFKGQ
jgi:hypothetical protein